MLSPDAAGIVMQAQPTRLNESTHLQIHTVDMDHACAGSTIPGIDQAIRHSVSRNIIGVG